MLIQAGSRFVILNRTTQEWSYCEVHECLSMGRAHVLWATLTGHEIWLPSSRGHVAIKATPSVPVLVPGEPPELVEAFVRRHNGAPLYMVERVEQVQAWLRGANIQVEPILNAARDKTGIHTDRRDKTAMLERAQAMVRMYDAWRKALNGSGT